MMTSPNVQSSSNLQAALRYATAGYPVLLVWPLQNGRCTCHAGAKCATPGKHPVSTNWNRTATTNEKRIRAMFARMPHAHIGIMPPEGHCIIDIDPRNGGSDTFRSLMNGARVPSTPLQHSGGGGRHLVFKGAPAGPLGKGIDVKRPGRGFVVAWPAGHVSGGSYKWHATHAPWDVTPADLPTQLNGGKHEPSTERDSAGIETPVSTTVPLATVREALAHVSADDYQRWVNIGQALRYNYGEDGEAVWLEWSRTSAKYQEGDEGKWDTFDKNRDRPLITVRSIMSIARRGGYRPLTKEFDQGLWAIGDISGLLDSAAPPLEWVLEPCVPAGKVAIVSGAGGSSKSFLTITLAMHLAIGQAFGPFKPEKPGKALLLVAEEDRQDIHRRLRTIKQACMFSDEQSAQITDRLGIVITRGMDWRLVYHDEAGDLQETDRVDYLIDEIRALGDVRLLVLDPLVAFNGANENDNGEMARLMFVLDRIADRTGAAVLALHHVSKGGQVLSLNDATQSVIRGASALVDNARSAILLTRMPRADAPLYGLEADTAGRYVVARVVKNNYGPHTDDAIFSVQAGGALRHAPEVRRLHNTLAAANRAVAERDIGLEVLRAHRDNPESTQRELADQLNVSNSRIAQVRSELERDGQLHRSGIGRTTRYDITNAGRQRISEADAEDLI